MHLAPKNVVLIAVVFAVGVGAGRFWTRPATVSASSAPQVVARLHRFSLKPDQLPEFDRWVAFEHAHHDETLATLEREHMYIETIFRDREHDPATIYWVELRGVGGAAVESSPLPIDKVYEEFMHRTLVPGPHRTLQPEYTLVAPFVQQAIAGHREPAAARKAQ